MEERHRHGTGCAHLKSLDEVKDKALAIHVGGDNMSTISRNLRSAAAEWVRLRRH